VTILNSILLAFDDPVDNEIGYPAALDTTFLVIYTIEMALKIFGMGFIFNRKAYLRDPWNIMDFFIVVTAYIPVIFTSNSSNLKVFVSLRVLRPLRTISNIKALKVLLVTLIRALGPLLDALLVLFFLFMIFAVAGLQLFMGLMKKRCFSLDEGIPIVSEELGHHSIENQVFCNGDSDCPSIGGAVYICGKMISNPNWGVTNFDTLPSALLMVFQIVTLEGWADILYYLSETFTPFAAIYFLILILTGAFFFLNLTLAVIKAEFTKNSNEERYSKKAKVILPKDLKIANKLEAHKGEVLKLIKKRKAEEISFNKYLFKKGNLIALDAFKPKSSKSKHPKRRRRNDELSTQIEHTNEKQGRRQFLGRGIRKSVGTIVHLLMQSNKKNKGNKILPVQIDPEKKGKFTLF